MWERSSAAMSAASALVNRIASRAYGRDIEKTTDDGEVLEEERGLGELLRGGIRPVTVRHRGCDDGVEHQRPGPPARFPANGERDTEAELEDDRDYGAHRRHRELPPGEVGSGRIEVRQLHVAEHNEKHCDEQSADEQSGRVLVGVHISPFQVLRLLLSGVNEHE